MPSRYVHRAIAFEHLEKFPGCPNEDDFYYGSNEPDRCYWSGNTESKEETHYIAKAADNRQARTDWSSFLQDNPDDNPFTRGRLLHIHSDAMITDENIGMIDPAEIKEIKTIAGTDYERIKKLSCSRTDLDILNKYKGNPRFRMAKGAEELFSRENVESLQKDLEGLDDKTAGLVEKMSNSERMFRYVDAMASVDLGKLREQITLQVQKTKQGGTPYA